MARKIRKQVYIDPEQEKLLKRTAQRTGFSEAEIIRNALDQGIVNSFTLAPRPDLWNSEVAFIKRRMKKGIVRGGRSWKRDDLHER